MNTANPLNSEFWIEYEPTPPVRICRVPNAHAIANARQAAQLLEDNRRAVLADEVAEAFREMRANPWDAERKARYEALARRQEAEKFHG